MNRERFFDTVRDMPFSGHLTPPQVAGTNALLDAFGDADRRWTAYGLATAYHETAHTMQPIEEIGHGHGRAYGKPAGRYGKVYYGRGYVQLTWLENYERADTELHESGFLEGSLVQRPELAMRPDIAAAIMVRGMTQGWFTGHKLADYFPLAAPTKSDWVNARRIINGTDQAWKIANYAKNFHVALCVAAKVDK